MDLPASASSLRPAEPHPLAPWWRFGMVWLVLAGPALAVLAGTATLTIAYRGADVALVTAPKRGAGPLAGATAPALQARNHAATPPRAPVEP